MTRHTFQTAVTRFVLIVSIITTVGVGSVGFGRTAEVAAMPVNCSRLWSHVMLYSGIGVFYEDRGDVSNAVYFFALAEHYEGQWVAADCDF